MRTNVKGGTFFLLQAFEQLHFFLTSGALYSERCFFEKIIAVFRVPYKDCFTHLVNKKSLGNI